MKLIASKELLFNISTLNILNGGYDILYLGYLITTEHGKLNLSN